MKKTLFTIGVILLSLSASAQYMITTTLNTPEEGESWETSHVTDNMGVAYTHSHITVGIVKNGEDYDMIGRYGMNNNIYICAQMSSESSDDLKIGIGYSLQLWKDLYIEPYYMKELDSEEEGSIKVGLSYKL